MASGDAGGADDQAKDHANDAFDLGLAGGAGATGRSDLEPAGGDDLAELDRWAAETRVADAVGQRRRAAWLARQSESETTLGGVLTALAELDQPVVVHLLDGRHHRGTVTAVGRDVVDLRSTIGARVLIATAAVASVRAEGSLIDAGDPTPPPRTDLASALARLADERTAVLVVTRTGSEATAGTAVAVGKDLLVLQGSGGGWIYVPLDALAEVSVPESG
jgi:hypothetical protein